MISLIKQIHWTASNQAVASNTAISGTAISTSDGAILQKADYIVASCYGRGGAAGGPVDLTVQYQVATDVWCDWFRSDVIATGVKSLTMFNVDRASIWTGQSIYGGTDTVPTVTAAPGGMTNASPSGINYRVVVTTGAGVNAAVPFDIYFDCFSRNVRLAG